MRSVTSFFNATLYKKNMKRFWPVWGLYLTIWLFIFPISLIMGEYNVKRFAGDRILDYVVEAGLPLAIIFSLLAAMAVWSYLFNNRSACLIHQLPIRREGLFLTNYLSGLSFMILPNAAVFALTLLAEALVWEPDLINLLSWLLAVSFMEVFFFSFATVCAMFTGHLLALPAFYAILNGLVFAVSILVEEVLVKFVYGFAGIPGINELVMYLTPAWLFGDGIGSRQVGADPDVYRLTGWGILGIYAALGLILAVLALVVYRRRHMEQAGDVVTVSWVRPVFRCGVGFCSALAFGMLIFEIFGDTLPETVWALLVLMLICGAVGYFIACMLLEKSFRVFRRWKGCAVLLAVLVVLACAVEFDLFGYESYVPEQEQVVSVELDMNNTRPHDDASGAVMEFDDPQVVQAVLDVHRAILDEKDINSDWGEHQAMPEGYGAQINGRSGFQVTYTLDNGRTVSRDYMSLATVNVEDLNDPKSLTAKLNTLINMPEFLKEGYEVLDLPVEYIREMNVTTLEVMEKEGYSIMSDVPMVKDADVYDKILQAVQKDLEEGNIRRYLMDDQERMTNCFVNDIVIVERRYDTDMVVDVKDDDVWTKWEMAAANEYEVYHSIGLQATAVHTLAALEEAGMLTAPVHLLTQAQVDAVESKWNNNGATWKDIDLNEYAWGVLGQ